MEREQPITSYVEVERRLWLVSPIVMSSLGMATYLFAFLFPPSLFERIVGEKSYVFLDFRTFLFNGACFACVLFGIYIAIFFRKRAMGDAGEEGEHGDGQTAPEVGTFPPMSRLAMVILLVTSTLCGMLSMAMTAKNVGIGNLASSMLSGGYRALVRQQLESETLGLGSLTPLMLPAFGLALMFAGALTHRKWSWAMMLFGITLLAFLFPVALFARRTFLLKPLFGMVLVGILFASYRMKRVVPLILFVGLSFMVLVLVVFSIFSMVRMETVTVEQQVNDFTRYVVTSYNNESMFIQGKMEWDGEGNGYYWTQFIWSFPFISNLVDLDNVREKYFGIRAPYGHSERMKILKQHGVKSSTNITAFGSSYIDFGVLGCLPFIITGFVLQLSFASFVRNRLFGMVLFPYTAWAVLDWRGNLSFPGTNFGYALILLGICWGLSVLFPPRRLDVYDGSELDDEWDDEEEEFDEEVVEAQR